MTNFLVENWFLIVIAVAAIIGAVSFAIKFINLPTKQKIESVKSWLLMAVVSAENFYGSKTGQIKLAYVYDMFISQFPALSRWVSFEKFSELVDEALDNLKKILAENPEVERRLFQSFQPYEGNISK